MRSLVEELQAIIPTRQLTSSWFTTLTPEQQADVIEVARLKSSGTLPHSWRQIGRLIKNRYSLAVDERYVACKLPEIAKEQCQNVKRSRTK